MTKISRRFTVQISLYMIACLYCLSTPYAMLVLHTNTRANVTLALLYLLFGIPLTIAEALLLKHWVSKAAAGVAEVIAMEDTPQRRVAADSGMSLVAGLVRRFVISMSIFNIGGFASGSLVFYLVADVYWLEAVKLAVIGIAVNLIDVTGVLVLLWRNILPELMIIVTHTTDPLSHFNVKMRNRVGVLFTTTSLSMMVFIAIWVHSNEVNQGLDIVMQRGYSLLSRFEQLNHLLPSATPAQALKKSEGIFTFDKQGRVVSETGNLDLKSLIPVEILEESQSAASGDHFVPESMIGIVNARLEDDKTLFFVGAVREASIGGRSLRALVFLFFIMVGFSFGFGMFLGDLSARPVSRLSSLLSESSRSGRFDKEIPIPSHDDIGLVAYTVRELFFRLNSYIGTLTETAGVVQDSLNEYTKFSHDMGTSSAQQSSALVEMSTTMEEMSRSSQGAAERSRKIQHSVKKANALSTQMKGQMDETYSGFDILNKKIESVDSQIEILLANSEAVDDIISEIRTIAQQSNLLAINASVEAAKAKEHGRGFGVLAKEMKLLSEQSRRSSETARDKLKSIQNAVKQTGASMQEGREISSRLVGMAMSTKESIAFADKAINKIDRDARQIVTTASEQVIGIKEVTTAVNEIKLLSLKLAEGNAKLAEAFIGLDSTAGHLGELSFS
jgi:methyl-accepting chemotaxis protein